MSFSGKKFKKTEYTNVKELINALNVDDKIKGMLRETTATTCFTKTADGKWNYRVETDKVLLDETFPLDADYDYVRPDGVINKTKFWLEGNTLKQVLHGSSGRKLHFDRAFDGDKMVMTVSMDGVPTKGVVNYVAV